jgi:TonB family protein
METLIYILKAHILFLILSGVYHFVLKNETSFTFNRFYLLALYGASILAPMLDFKILNNITIIDSEFFRIEPTAALANASEIIKFDLWTFETIFPLIYGLLVSISIIRFLIKFANSYHRFNQLHRFSKLDYKRNVYWIDDDVPPFTFLNKTVLPLKLVHDSNHEVIIKHEEAHRKTLHFFDIIWIELLSSLLIFNPLNKRIKKYVVENHEYLADEYACQTTNKSQYAQILIRQTLNQHKLHFVSYFAKPTVLKRLNMLKNSKKSNLKPIVVGSFFIFISALFSCDLNPTEEFILKDDNKEIADDLSEGVDENTVFSIVENQAEPKEGIQAFYDAISKRLNGNYPTEAIRNGIEGVVYVQFVIEKNGSLSNIQAVKGIGGGCDELAVKMLQNYGNWNPGRQKGKTVRSRGVVPIRFALK